MDKHEKKIVMRHRDRIRQVPIYLGKLLRSFIFMSDWKMLPMSAVIAALVCMVVRKTYFLTMDGTLKGSFAFCCVSIWNGCFNSIQVICRERPIVKREHRSGMHITSYITAHMIYQGLLCAAQTVITIGVCTLCGVKFPSEGFITSFFKLDIGITLFLIAYASDMLSLLISAIAHSTTAAMTVMPFILIFQLVFSGGFFALPKWAGSLTNISISNYGLCCLNAQANYNELPMTAAWTALERMENSEITGTITVGEIMDAASDANGILKNVRDQKIDLKKMVTNALTAEGIPAEDIEIEEEHPGSTMFDSFPESEDEEEITAAEIVQETEAETKEETSNGETTVNEPTSTAENEIQPTEAPNAKQDTAAEETPKSGETTESETSETAASEEDGKISVGELIDSVLQTDILSNYRDLGIPYSFSVSSIIDYIGRDTLKTEIEQRSAAAMASSSYERTESNIFKLWGIMLGFSFLYALIATVFLEFIDKDKR